MKKLLMLAWLSSLLGLNAAPLEIGAALPELEAKNQDGEVVKVAQKEGDQYLFVFFYPKAMTGGCTKQVCSVRDSFEDLGKKKVTVFGVSTDKVDDQKKFVEKEELQYELLADPDKKIVDAFGVPAAGNFASRSAYLFKDGVLVWQDLKGATATQGKEILAAIEEVEAAK